MRKFAAILLKEENSYNLVLEYLLSKDFYYNEDSKLPFFLY